MQRILTAVFIFFFSLAYVNQTLAILGQTQEKRIYANLTQPSRHDAMDKQDIMEEALELINEAHIYWTKGDIEVALDILDQAYALVLDTNGNPIILRQKDDIRLLVARKILAIYSSLATNTNGIKREIPLVLTPEVEREIRSFQTSERSFFIQSYHRSAIYMPLILRELKKAGLPEELAWLPLVESGFKINALSPARALGLWQFIPSTGYKYGLNRCDWIDERMDAEKSTLAAIAYLKELHGMFGDWLTALAAYNCGEGRVLRVISSQHINYFDRFWDLYNQLPYETARYVPRFLATLHIVQDPQKYGFDFNSEPNEKRWTYSYQTVKINKSMRLQDIAVNSNISEELLGILNAELRLKITPDREYDLKLPSESVSAFLDALDSIPSFKRRLTKVIRHRVKKTDTIESIAQAYNVSPRELKSVLAKSGKKQLVAGKFVTVAVKDVSEVSSDTAKDTARQVGPSPKNVSVTRKQAEERSMATANTYVVQKGDNLNVIAKKNNTTVENILKANKITNKNLIVPGQKITVK